MPTDNDLFTEEKHMVAMSFGDHIEELRVRLILALLGLFVGLVLTFIPFPNLDLRKLEWHGLGWRVMTEMQMPAKGALTSFYKERAKARSADALRKQVFSPTIEAIIPADALADAIRQIAPAVEFQDEARLKGLKLRLPMQHAEAGFIQTVAETIEPREALITLAPLESMTIFFMVCLITGLVIASPWVFYQVWAFIAAGLYRHERHYVMKFLPLSLGLFLMGIFLCFFFVLPFTLGFLLEFNVWLGIEPTLRLTDWMNFATMLPLVFGLCFQTPLVMLLLERIGILSVEDFRSKRKMAILVIVVIAAVVTPTQDPFGLALLALPMIVLYELGILLISRGRKPVPAEMV